MKRIIGALLAAFFLLGCVQPGLAAAPTQCVNAKGTAVDCGSVPWSYTRIATATTTTVKPTPGVLHAITVGTLVASATITVYDNTAGSGTKLATLTLPSTITGVDPFTVILDVGFGTGLTIVTSGATDITVASQ